LKKNEKKGKLPAVTVTAKHLLAHHFCRAQINILAF